MESFSPSIFTTPTPQFPFSSSFPPPTTPVSFSLKPPPPPQPQPQEPFNPANSPSLRRPKSLKPTRAPTPTSIPSTKHSKNPLKTLLKPPSPPPASANPHSLSSKLWLSSKLSPPPPSPPPPPPPPLLETKKIRTTKKIQETKNDQKNEETEIFRQEGKIFVGNLPTWIKKHELTEFFRQFGPIENVILIKGHNETERNAGFGFVIYQGATAEKSAMKAVEFDGVEFHGRVLTVKLDDGRRLKAKAEERKRWVEGENVEGQYRSKWHEERDGSRKVFRRVLETQPENWQAVVSAFERVKKVKISV